MSFYYYSPPYEREIWHYDQANVDYFRKALDLLPWKKTLRNLNINELILLFNKKVKNVISNYIPHGTFDNRDPPWINKNAKQLTLEKNEIYKRYVNENKDPKTFEKVKYLQNKLNISREITYKKYILRNLFFC